MPRQAGERRRALVRHRVKIESTFERQRVQKRARHRGRRARAFGAEEVVSRTIKSIAIASTGDG